MRGASEWPLRASFHAPEGPGAGPSLRGAGAEVAGNRRSYTGFDAIRHPDVHVQERADVVAFLVRQPVLIAGRGDGAVAAEAYRVTASITVMAMLEVGMMAMLEVGAIPGQELRICGHMLAYFQAPERPDAVFIVRSLLLIWLHICEWR